jgi:hypothetical protein
MSQLDPPPEHLSELKLPIFAVRRRTGALVRLAWPDPGTHCGFRRDARYRFDAPDGAFGVLYAAFDLKTAFAETVLRDTPARTKAAKIRLDYAELEARRVVAIDTHAATRPLRLIKLYGDGLVAARTDNRIATLDEYSWTRAWAKALHAHPQQADGIVYLSRFMAPHKAVVLFDRSQPFMKVGTVTPLLLHKYLPKILDDLELSIDPP